MVYAASISFHLSQVTKKSREIEKRRTHWTMKNVFPSETHVCLAILFFAKGGGANRERKMLILTFPFILKLKLKLLLSFFIFILLPTLLLLLHSISLLFSGKWTLNSLLWASAQNSLSLFSFQTYTNIYTAVN